MPSCSPRPRGLNKLSVESNGGADPISDVTQEAVINPNSLALEKKAGQEVGAASTASLLGKNAGQVDTSSSIASRLEKFRYDPSRPVEPRTPVLVDRKSVV